MAPLKAGDKFPDDVKFDWAPVVDLDPKVCSRPQPLEASKQWKGKRIVIVSFPGAATPTCQENHLPPYIEKIEELKAKGVDQVAVIAYNDAFVMALWAKVNGVKGEDIVFLSDTGFAKKHGWTAGPERNGRFAIIIEKDGTVSYAEAETKPGEVGVSGADAVLSKL